MSYSSYSQGFLPNNSHTSNEIRQEILRFESVHPSIYAIYDLIEGITDLTLQNQIRDHVVNIEGEYILYTNERYLLKADTKSSYFIPHIY